MNFGRKLLGVSSVLTLLVLAFVVNRATGVPVPFGTEPIGDWSVDGRVYAMEIVDRTVIVGGTFSNATSSGGDSVARSNLAAFDLDTGELVEGFVANTNGAVRALEYVGGQMYVGGSFRNINGVTKNRLAAINPQSGAVNTAFHLSATSHVYALASTSNRLFLGGAFGTFAGQSHGRLAAVNLLDGTADHNFNAGTDANVFGLSVSPDESSLHLGGTFTSVNGEARDWLATVDSADGTLDPTTYDARSIVIDLESSGDGAHVFGAIAGSGNQAAAHSTADGLRVWRARADGDVQAVHESGGNVYYGFHESYEGDTMLKMMAADGTTGVVEDQYRVPLDDYWGVWDIDSTSDRLVVGGEFTYAGGTPVSNFMILPALDDGGNEPSVLVEYNSEWEYLDAGTNPDASWDTPAFAGTWASGAAELGYGDGDEATVVSYGDDPDRKHYTTWFRQEFELDELPTGALVVELLADDGAPSNH